MLRRHHQLYADNMSGFLRHRRTDNASHSVLRATADDRDVVFVLQPTTSCRVIRPAIVLNGGYASRLTVDAQVEGLSFTVLSPTGQALTAERPHPGGPLTIDVPPGGGIAFEAASASEALV